MKSVMKHSFGRIPQTEISRSTFDRSHGIKTAFDSGYLVPIYVDEVLPGDTFKLTANMLARMSTPIVPIMDNVFLETQWFFCPSRLLWTNFTKMMGERVNPKDSIDYLVPQINSGTGFAVGSLADYFGIPTGIPNINVSALPFRMYAKVWDDWYRDENLQDSIIQSTDDLGDTNGDIPWNTLLRRGKRRDYFTGCLPWPQKGEGVELPLGGEAPVYGDGKSLLIDYGDGVGRSLAGPSQASLNGVKISTIGSASTGTNLGTGIATATHSNAALGVASKELAGSSAGLVADLSSATAATINSLRTAFQLQKLLEADARGGTRYVELIRNHFKTICPDARLQRSEYLGGSSQLISVNQVAQTSSTDGETPQGNLAAYASVFDKVHINKSFTEHGFIIGLVNVRADLNYQQGLNRMWSRRGRYDFYWPVLAHLGEQAVLNKEIFAQGNSQDDEVFGYQERYAEYRYHPSVITGKLRSTSDTPLDIWHLAQKFDSLPKLSAQFIEDNPPISRVLAVQDEPQFIFDGYIKAICTRPMPVYSVPGLVDHF